MVIVFRQVGDETKIRELEPRADAATNQRIVAETAGCLPRSRGDDGGRLDFGGGRREHAADQGPLDWLVSEQFQRRSRIKMPNFIGLDDVPAAGLMTLK